MPTRRGAIRLFRLFGITVYIHWAWFFAFIYLTSRPREYSSYGWNALEVLSLFLIVLTHEFGHQLACRQVGGATSDIVLWPLGGVAYVMPPQRAGAQLWSIAAGPLVNVILIPLTALLVSVSSQLNWNETYPDLNQFVHNIFIINLVLLAFNLLPVYPLDGGQILRSLLWFVLGRANSLMAASVVGFAGVAGLIGMALWAQSFWLGLMAAFIAMNCWAGFKQARALVARARLPRRSGLACPHCHANPVPGDLWRCGQCGQGFDIFLSHGQCPQCGAQFNAVPCLECGQASARAQWELPPALDG